MDQKDLRVVTKLTVVDVHTRSRGVGTAGSRVEYRAQYIDDKVLDYSAFYA